MKSRGPNIGQNLTGKIDNDKPKRWNLTKTSQQQTLTFELGRKIDEFDRKSEI